MPQLVKTAKRDSRDKRYVRPRRRIRLPWFVLACAVVLLSVGWLAKRAAPARLFRLPTASHSGDAAAAQGNDW